jgi:hypothetical protein
MWFTTLRIEVSEARAPYITLNITLEGPKQQKRNKTRNET